MRIVRSRNSRGITDVQVVLIIAVGIIASIALVSYFLVSSFLTGSFVPGLGGGIEIEESETRSATLMGDEAALEFSTFNGQVTLIPTSGNDVTITITKMGRRAQLDDVDISFAASLNPGGRETVSLFVTRTTLLGSSATVHLEALVPMDISYDIDVSTLNGRIEIRQLHGSELDVETGNGAIALDDLKFDTIQAGTSNGRVNGIVESGEVKVDTSNGAIDLIVSGGGEYDLTTLNGAIDVTLRDASGVRVDASTSNGLVDWIGGPAGQAPNRLIAEMEGVPATQTITLLLRTVNGNITIQTLR